MKRHYVFLSLHIGSLMAAVLVFWFFHHHNNRIVPGVRIGTIAVGSKTIQEAEILLESSVAQKRLGLLYGADSWQPRFQDLGITFQTKPAVLEAFDIGRRSGPWKFVRAVMLQRPIHIQYDWSDQKLEVYLKEAAQKIGGVPKDAQVAVVDGSFTVIPEQEGLVIDAGELKTQLGNAPSLAAPKIIDLKVQKAQPEVSGEALKALLPEAEALVAEPLQLQREETIVTVEPQIMKSWIEFHRGQRIVSALGKLEQSKKVELKLNREAIASYLRTVSSQLETAPEPERLLLSKNKVEVLAAGKPGKRLVLEEAAAMIQQQLETRDRVALIVPFVEVAAPIEYEQAPEAPIKQGKVIAVDLTKLLEYLYENGELVYSAKISPGINDWTPTGTFKIYAKTKKQKMSGPGYYLPNVPNILWFKGDYSIHGVYWHNDFGIRPRSHGCVGQSLEDAEWVFNWAEVGTPVVIYKS